MPRRRHSKRSSSRTQYRRYRSGAAAIEDDAAAIEAAVFETRKSEAIQDIDQSIRSDLVNNLSKQIVEFESTVKKLNKQFFEIQSIVDALKGSLGVP